MIKFAALVFGSTAMWFMFCAGYFWHSNFDRAAIGVVIAIALFSASLALGEER